MTDSYVQVPSDSTGKLIATNQINGKQIQIVNVADASGNLVSPTDQATETAFYSRALVLLNQAVEFLRAPTYLTRVSGGDKIQVIASTDTSLLATVPSFGPVTTVIDARELIWSLWDTEYNTGIRMQIK